MGEKENGRSQKANPKKERKVRSLKRTVKTMKVASPKKSSRPSPPRSNVLLPVRKPISPKVKTREPSSGSANILKATGKSGKPRMMILRKVTLLRSVSKSKSTLMRKRERKPKENLRKKMVRSQREVRKVVSQREMVTTMKMRRSQKEV